MDSDAIVHDRAWYREHPKLAPSEAELAALRAVMRYGTTRAAATKLFLSRHTVANHIAALRWKSGLSHTHQVILWAVRNGWVEDEEAGR